MRDDPAALNATEGDAPRGLAARVRTLLSRQLHVLLRLADKGVEIAQGLSAQAVALATSAPVRALNRLSLAHARAARAVMMAILLQSRLLAELDKPDSQLAEAFERGRDDGELQVTSENGLNPAAPRVPRGERPDGQARERLDDLTADQRALDRLARYVQSRPVEELIEEICRALGLGPEWLRHAEEEWEREQAQSAELPRLAKGRPPNGGAPPPPSSAGPTLPPEEEDPGPTSEPP